MQQRVRLAGITATTVFLLAGCAGDPAVDASAPPITSPSSAASTTISPSSAVTTTGPTASVTPTASISPTSSPPTPAEPKLGQRQETDLGKVIVYSVEFPVQGTADARSIRTKGMQFAVVDIKVCANGTVDEDGYGFDAGNFQLTDDDDRTYEFWNVQIGARSPNLTDSVSGLDTPRKGSCKRGWLTFELPPKTKISSVDYNPSGGGTPLSWQA